MPVDIKAPTFPESVEEGTLQAWHKSPGDPVQRDEKLADIETDKVVLEVAAEQDGVLASVAVAEGETVTSEQVIGVLGEPGTAADDTAESSGDGAAGDAPESPPSAPPADAPAEADPAPPAAAKPAAPKPKKQAAPDDTAWTPDPRGEERVPMTRLRARIAQRLKEAQDTAAILTTFNEVNMQPVMDLRSRLKERFQKVHGVKLGFMSFFVKAAVEALKSYPVINATLDGNDVVYHDFFDISIAISSDRGLVVPVLKDAERKSFAEIEAGIVDFATRAREGGLSLDELTGGTFTITNGGIFGSMLSTPILNPPQSAILGMHKIEPRPVAEDGQVVVRPVMYLALSYDHRIIDGREAVLFLVAIKEFLEEPGRMLLEV